MQPPDNASAAALQYVAIGASVIPLAPREKRPWTALLPDGQWRQYQQQRATQADVLTWARVADEPPNWGVVCGSVSGGLYCGDCDDIEFSAWILDHAADPVFRGACIVRTGSGKVHVWFRSPNPVQSGTWRPRGGKKVGDIRGDGAGAAGGSYMVVPPSVHPSGDVYVRVRGSFKDLPVIENGAAFLADILAAYLATHPGEAPAVPASNDKRFMILDGDDQIRVYAHVRGLKIRKRIEDTILKPGNQAHDSRHWLHTRASSYSDVDYAVVCELVGKHQTYEQVEEIFAACPIGDACYRNASRGNHGYAYLKLTYDNARAEVERQRQSARVAAGNNFKVTEVTCTDYGKRNPVFHVTFLCTRSDTSTFTVQADITHDELGTEQKARAAVFAQTRFVLSFAQGHRGSHFPDFVQALSEMVSEIRTAPETYTRLGVVATWLRERMTSLPNVVPNTKGEAPSVGWAVGGVYHFRVLRLVQDVLFIHRGVKAEEIPDILGLIGAHETLRHDWPDGSSEPIIRLIPQRPG